MVTQKIKQKAEKAKQWVIEHKKEIIICGGVVICIGAGIIGFKYLKSIKSVVDVTTALPIQPPPLSVSSADLIAESCNAAREIARRDFIRVLPKGHQASLTKILQAKELGIALEVGETIVDSCIVRLKCA